MKFDISNEWMILDTWYFWYLIFLRLDISETQYFCDPIFLRPDISETWYFWDLIFLRSDSSETQYFWDPIFLVPNISDLFVTFLMDIFGFLFRKHKIYSRSQSFEHFLLLFIFVLLYFFDIWTSMQNLESVAQTRAKSAPNFGS